MKRLVIVSIMMVAFFQGPFAQGAQTNGAVMTDVSFKAKIDGTEQKYVRILPAQFTPEGRYDVLIALHGHGSDRWQFAKDKRAECRAARDVAAKQGMIYISPDYRASTSWMGPKAEADVAQIIEDLKLQYRVARVLICGASMGGTASLTFAVRRPDLVDGVASMNGTANFLEYANFQDAIQASFGGTKDAIPDEYKNRSAEFWPGKLTMPVGITASGKDASVPPMSVLRLAEALKKANRKVLLIYRKDAGHNTSYEDASKILDFMVLNAKINTTGKR